MSKVTSSFIPTPFQMFFFKISNTVFFAYTSMLALALKTAGPCSTLFVHENFVDKQVQEIHYQNRIAQVLEAHPPKIQSQKEQILCNNLLDFNNLAVIYDSIRRCT